MTLAQAIAHVEGWYAQGTTKNRPQRNNNPGDLEYTVFTIGAGSTGTDGRFAVFKCATDGWSALYMLLMHDYATLTVQQMVNKFAPPNENNDANYVNIVCKLVHCNASDLVIDCLM